MFRWCGRLIDRILVVAGALVFAQVPLFIQQYSHRLAGHVAELRYQLNQLRIVAESSGKSFEAYIQKFIDAGDADFVGQGKLIQAMITRSNHLTESLSAITEASPLTRPFAFLSHLDTDIVKGTVHSFTLGVPLTLEAGIYALVGILVGYGLYRTLRRIFYTAGSLFRRKKPAQI